MIAELAARTAGFAGADLQALCSAAAMAAVKRSVPGIFDELTTHYVSSSSADRQSASRQQLLADVKVHSVVRYCIIVLSTAHARPFGLAVYAGFCMPFNLASIAAQNAFLTCFEARESLLQVLPSDWHCVLQQAPLPCSRRQGMAALTSDQAKQLKVEGFSALRAPLHQALRCLHSSGMPLPSTAAAATQAAAMFSPESSEFEAKLKSLGVIASLDGLDGAASVGLNANCSFVKGLWPLALLLRHHHSCRGYK